MNTEIANRTGHAGALSAAQVPDLHNIIQRLSNVIDHNLENTARLENLNDRLHGTLPSEVGRDSDKSEPSNTVAKLHRAIDILQAIAVRNTNQIDRLEGVTG